MNDRITEDMKELLSIDWRMNKTTKKVWEWIRDNELTAAPAFKGKLYDVASVKIMYVGHAVNGWEVDFNNCSTLDNTLDSIMNQQNGIPTLVEHNKYKYTRGDGKEAYYNHINSRFWRLIKQILEQLYESDGPISSSSWYSDSKNWNEKLVWSNVFCIAPRNGGNPADGQIKKGFDTYVDILKLQIEMYNPDVVIFCPLKGYFEWDAKRNGIMLSNCFNVKMFEKEDHSIIGTGKYKNSNIIVCFRPDKRGKSYDDVEKMAMEIAAYIKEL